MAWSLRKNYATARWRSTSGHEWRLDWKAKRQPKLEPLKLSKIEAAMSFTIAKGMVAQTAGKHYPAPITAVKTIEAAASWS